MFHNKRDVLKWRLFYFIKDFIFVAFFFKYSKFILYNNNK